MKTSGRFGARTQVFYEPLEHRRLLAAQVVGSWNFEDSLTTNFSGGMISTTPLGARKFLETAQTTQQRTISLDVDSLPAHQKLTIRFDLYIINSWDGDTGFFAPVGRPIGPDWWGFTGGTPADQQVLYAEQTFSTLQEPPYNFPQSAGPPDEEDTLGYFLTDSNGTFAVDMVYHIERTLDHTADAARFLFTGRTGSTGGGEAWGLDNVQLTAEDVPEPAAACLALLGLRFALERRSRRAKAAHTMRAS
jgi:hypothetical protein